MVVDRRDLGGGAAGLQPAEWAPHRGCITAWPEHEYAWEAALAAAQDEFAFFLEAFCAHAGEPMWLLCSANSAVRQRLGHLQPQLRFVDLPYGDVWLRDTAPVWLTGGRRARRFRFNGWGGKYPYPHDSELAERIAGWAGAECAEVPLVSEGGAFEVDGLGTCITTRACILNDNRNPGLTQPEAEACFAEWFGVRTVVWLDAGLAHDHTDGHVDNIARFVGGGQVLCMAPSGQQDPNREVLLSIQAQLREAMVGGKPLEVLTLPSPGLIEGEDGMPMPASYMNFYIANGAVFVPSYGVDNDRIAQQVIGGQFPGRRVELVPSRAILSGGGSLHCVTQQMPKLEEASE